MAKLVLTLASLTLGHSFFTFECLDKWEGWCHRALKALELKMYYKLDLRLSGGVKTCPRLKIQSLPCMMALLIPLYMVTVIMNLVGAFLYTFSTYIFILKRCTLLFCTAFNEALIWIFLRKLERRSLERKWKSWSSSPLWVCPATVTHFSGFWCFLGTTFKDWAILPAYFQGECFWTTSTQDRPWRSCPFL